MKPAARTAWDGARCLLAGFRHLPRPGLKRFVLLPLLVNLLLFAGLTWWATSGFGALLDWLLPELPDWLAWLAWLLWLLFALLVMLVMFFTFTLLANLIGAPFNSLLAARVEQRVTGQAPPQGPASGLAGLAAETGRALRDELRKLGYFLGWGLLLAVISLVLLFIPVLNALVPALWFIYGSWVMALEYSDYPLGNQGLAFPTQRAHIREQRWPALGFGAAVMLATLIPIVNFVTMPAAVVGATLLWSRRDQDD